MVLMSDKTGPFPEVDQQEWAYDRIRALEAENERLQRENDLAGNELVEYAKLAARGTDKQLATINQLRAALEQHHDLLSDEPGDYCKTCGLTWDASPGRL